MQIWWKIFHDLYHSITSCLVQKHLEPLGYHQSIQLQLLASSYTISDTPPLLPCVIQAYPLLPQQVGSHTLATRCSPTINQGISSFSSLIQCTHFLNLQTTFSGALADGIPWNSMKFLTLFIISPRKKSLLSFSNSSNVEQANLVVCVPYRG